MYSRSQEAVSVGNILLHCGTHETPDNYIKYITALIARREEWALAFRHDLPTNGKDTNNTAESAMRIFKEKVSLIVRVCKEGMAVNYKQLF